MGKTLIEIITEQILISKTNNHPKIAVQLMEQAIDKKLYSDQLHLFGKAIEAIEKQQKENNNE